MMNRYFVQIAFRGTDFHGWQVQPEKITVQGTINQALSTILQEDIYVVGCGRTDAGVHASKFYFHFDSPKKLPENLLYKLNSVLPKSIVVYQILPVPLDQHSRFDANKRSYVYHCHFTKNPFLQAFSWEFLYPIVSIENMNKCASLLPQFTNFEPLSKANPEIQSSECTIFESKIIWDENGQKMQYHISANRFLHNMVRRVVGLLMCVGQNKISIQEVTKVLSKGQTFSLNFVAPPEGLFLTDVAYNFLHE